MVLFQRCFSTECRFDELWMTEDFASFPTLFQSYQDDKMEIMKGCEQKEPRLWYETNDKTGVLFK